VEGKAARAVLPATLIRLGLVPPSTVLDAARSHAPLEARQRTPVCSPPETPHAPADQAQPAAGHQQLLPGPGAGRCGPPRPGLQMTASMPAPVYRWLQSARTAIALGQQLSGRMGARPGSEAHRRPAKPTASGKATASRIVINGCTSADAFPGHALARGGTGASAGRSSHLRQSMKAMAAPAIIGSAASR